jgi:hypothetical protein
MPEKEVLMKDLMNTREMIDNIRSKLGIKLRFDDCIHDEEATRMAIPKFIEGIGDPNLLWKGAEVVYIIDWIGGAVPIPRMQSHGVAFTLLSETLGLGISGS